MGFISLYLKVLKEHYVDFKGRAGRAEFWTVFLINALVAWLLMWGFGLIKPMLGQIIGGLFNLAVLLPGLSVAVRRMHDIGKGGGWIFITLIPIIGFIWFIILCAKVGEEGQNRFGDPAPACDPTKNE